MVQLSSLSWRGAKNCRRLCARSSIRQLTTENRGKLRLYYNDVYEVPLPETHKFPMEKYRYIRNGLQDEFRHKQGVEFVVSPLASREDLILTHSEPYVDRFISGKLTPNEVRRVGFPWSEEHVNRSLSSVGGTVAATRYVLTNKDVTGSAHLAGGTHHAFFDYGEGFCVFNDIAVACNVALKEYDVNKILVIDLDVHQGNGTASLFNDELRVFTFSMHCKQNYFSAKERSDLDVELDSGCSDDEYLRILDSKLNYLMSSIHPELIFYQAGVDICEGDRLGKLKVSRSGANRRNQMVFETAKKHSAKVVATLGGGYPRDLNPQSDPFRTIIEAHKDVYRSLVSTLL